jgi:archaellin
MTRAWSKRGEAAIGSSILFIAMISMSTMAGSMVLNNTSMGAEEAQEVFDESLESVVNHVDIRTVVGVCDPYRGEVTSVELLVVLGAGSKDLNLSSITVEVVLPDAHAFLINGSEGFQAERISSGGNANSTSVIADGDFWLLRLTLPKAAQPGDSIRISITPASGYANFVILKVPDTVTTRYISFR